MNYYIDESFFVNAAADYILLLVAARIVDTHIPRWRMILAALFGGLYAAFACFPALQHPLSILSSGLIISSIAFLGNKKFIRLTLLFFAVSASFGGGVIAVSAISGGHTGIFALAVVFAICFAAFLLIFRRSARSDGKISVLSISCGERSITVNALSDTGNSLSEPISGRRVAVISLYDAMRLFTEEKPVLSMLGYSDAPTVLQSLGSKRFRLVPYSSVGVKNGLLLAFSPDAVTVDGKRADYIIGISPSAVCDNGKYDGIIQA